MRADNRIQSFWDGDQAVTIAGAFEEKLVEQTATFVGCQWKEMVK